MPAAYAATSTSFPVQVLWRTGSVFDFGTSATSIMATGLWTMLVTTSITTVSTMAVLSSSLNLTIPAGGRVSLWLSFTDGNRPSRDAAVKVAATTSMPNFTTTADGALTISYAMQVRTTQGCGRSAALLTRHCACVGYIGNDRQLGKSVPLERGAGLLRRSGCVVGA